MGAATIFGDTYTTAIMPDGKEWLAENLRTTLAPNRAPNGNEANVSVYGRLYQYDINTILTYPAGWRVPTQSEWDALIVACGGAATAGGKLKSTGTAWQAPNTGATDEFGFAALPAGSALDGTSFFEFGQYANFWTAWALSVGLEIRYLSYNATDVVSYDLPSGNPPSDYWYSVRLVREYTPAQIFHGFEGMDFLVAPEWGYEPKISPSLSWTKTASGLWRCLDDGAAFDAYDAEITVKVSGAVHSAWEAFIAANRGAEVTYFAPSGVRPFGPHIDCTTGVQVVIGDAWSTDWRVGITADCYTIHIPMRYVGGYTPTLATMPAVVARKYPTPTWFYPTKVHATEAGTATAAPRDTETQTTQVIVDNLDQAGAAAMVNWCLYQRGASFTYTPTAGCFPFGVAAGNGPFTVRLIGWTSQKPKPNRWDMTLDFAREA